MLGQFLLITVLLFEVRMCMWKHLRVVIAFVKDLNDTYVLLS
jgi:hypothetical protein